MGKVIALAGILVAASCAAPEPPAQRRIAGEFCTDAAHLLGDPWLDGFQKAALLQKMNNRGCLD